MKRLMHGIAVLTIVSACTMKKEPPAESISSEKNEARGTSAAFPAPDANGVAPTSAKSTEAPPKNENCKELPEQYRQLPAWIADKGIVVTKILKECVTSEGRQGYESDSPWLAMGIPCSGDGGKIDYKGERYDPKLVSLIISTDCGMNPSAIPVVKAAGEAALGLSPSSRLLAYNPLAIQYWEIPGLGDADVGFTVDLRTTEALQKVWKNFSEQQSIPVRLYGRENAWGMGDQFFFIKGELVKTGNLSFRLQVSDVKPLGREEIAQVKANCEALRPPRNCFKVFK